MFFLADLSTFKRGRDKRKRKTRLGSLSILTTPAGASLGASAGLASGILLAKRGIAKPMLTGALGGSLLGAGIGYGVGRKMDKSMKFGDYQREIGKRT